MKNVTLSEVWEPVDTTVIPPQKLSLSIQILLFPVYSTDIDAKNVEKMSNKSELEKIFLLTLVQNAKCYRITRQENPEFLGEFHGGAKTTSNSGVISFEYREIWEGYAWCVSSLTYQEWMKYQVIGNQIKEENFFDICIKSVYRYERRRERKGKKLVKSRPFCQFWVISSKSKSNSTNFLPR